MSTIERRMLPADEMPLDIEEREGGLPIIRGMAAVYNKPSRDLGGFREVILPGAFDHILERKYKKMDVVALWNHDANQLLGRTSSGTLRLSSDERGLKYELDPPATTLARDLMTLVRRSDVFGSSFAFTVSNDDQSYDETPEGTVRTIRKVSGLYDVSLVTNPAYLDTQVAVRSFEEYKAARDAELEPERMPALNLRLLRSKALARAACLKFRRLA